MVDPSPFEDGPFVRAIASEAYREERPGSRASSNHGGDFNRYYV